MNKDKLLQGLIRHTNVVEATHVGRKMDKAKVKRIAVSVAAVASIMMGATVANAQDARIKDIIKEVDQSNKIAQASQQRIDGIADATAKLFGEYRATLKTNAGLEAYNELLRKQIADQEKTIAGIKNAIAGIDEIKRQVSPLMLEMIDNLEEFVNSDTPFQKDIRLSRINDLRDVMTREDVADPERFRVVLEAYKNEVSYGGTRGFYEGQLEDGRSVNFIRLGRVGFYYQTKDGAESAAWNSETNSWQILGPEYATALKQLMKMTRGQAPSDVLILPIPAPKEK